MYGHSIANIILKGLPEINVYLSVPPILIFILISIWYWYDIDIDVNIKGLGD